MNNENKQPQESPRLPAVTFFLFAYNQCQYVEAACRAAFAQSYAPLEIVFSDDCSTDGTFEKLEEIVRNYSGPHKVRLNKNDKNLGLIGHVNKSFEMASGDLIIAAAGDDISEPDRVECLVAAYRQARGSAWLIHSNATKINDANDVLGLYVPPVIEAAMTLPEMADGLSLYIGATAAWDRRLYDFFGPIMQRDTYEDLILGFRAAIEDGLVYIDKPLVRYRVGVGISTARDVNSLTFPEKIEQRKKNQKHALAVYTQRSSDLSKANSENGEVAGILDSLARKARKFEKKLLFHSAPWALLASAFKKGGVESIRAFFSESTYVVKMWLRSF